jgi:GntR family transcriptional repressor for pyruvate dehydrogenase complex
MSDSGPFSPIKHTRAVDEIILQLEELMLDGILRGGDKLPGERDLAAQLAVSRPILREALKELEQRGLLISRHGGGTFVADLVGEMFSEPLSNLITRHARAAKDYLEYRRHIEALSAELAATRATESDLARMGKIIHSMQLAHAAGDTEAEMASDVELHNAIGEAAHNIVLLHSLRSCFQLLREDVFFNRRMIFSMDAEQVALLAQHLAIFEAIKQRDPIAALRAAEDHIDFIAKATDTARAQLERERLSTLRASRSSG